MNPNLAILFSAVLSPPPPNPICHGSIGYRERKFTQKESYFISMSEHMKSRDAKTAIFPAAYTFQTYLSI